MGEDALTEWGSLEDGLAGRGLHADGALREPSGGWERVFMHREPERGQPRPVLTWARELRGDQASSEPGRGMASAAGHSEGWGSVLGAVRRPS